MSMPCRGSAARNLPRSDLHTNSSSQNLGTSRTKGRVILGFLPDEAGMGMVEAVRYLPCRMSARQQLQGTVCAIRSATTPTGAVFETMETRLAYNGVPTH